MFSKFWIIPVLIILTSGIALADDYSDFRIPKHRVTSLVGTLGGNYRSDYWNSDPSNYKTRSWELNGYLNSDAVYLLDSDPLRAQINFGTDFRGNQNHEKSTSPAYIGTQEVTNRLKRVSENLDLSCSGYYYPFSIPLGIDGSASGNAWYGQEWSSATNKTEQEYQRNETNNDRTSWIYEYEASLGLGFGYGRVRDASSVFDIHNLERRLLEEGALTGPLSKETKQQLIDIAYRRYTDYSIVYQRPERFYWKDIETVLLQDPALKAGALDAYNLYRMAEPIDGSRLTRQKGFFIGPKINANHYNRITRSTLDQSQLTVADSGVVSDTSWSEFTREVNYNDRFDLGGGAEYYLPIGDRWQFNARVAAYRPLNNMSKAYVQNTYLRAQYIIADRWQANLSFSQSREIFESKSQSARYQTDRWGVSTSLGLRYFVEDNLSLDLSINQYQSSYKRYYKNDYTTQLSGDYSRDATIDLRLEYFFTGTYVSDGVGNPKSSFPRVPRSTPKPKMSPK